VHSPYNSNVENINSSYSEDKSPYSNPLDAIEAFKKNALEELMRQHNLEYSQKSGVYSENHQSEPKYDYVYDAAKNEDQSPAKFTPGRVVRHFPVRPTEGFEEQHALLQENGIDRQINSRDEVPNY
jgi:hypothetical protein